MSDLRELPRHSTNRRRSPALLIIGIAVVVVVALVATLAIVLTRGDSPEPGGAGARADGSTTAAERLAWGQPNRVDEFDAGLGPDWNVYDGVGHGGNGRRSPDAFSTSGGVLTVTGDGEGTTGGMGWGSGQKYGRWEARVKAPVGDPTYSALVLLWPDAENWPVGGEIDFMELTDPTRQSAKIFVHFGENDLKVESAVAVDATQWHNWAVEWTPDYIAAYLDGKEWYRVTDKAVQPPGPMHLTIQLDWFPEGDGQVKTSSMQVDWVKQYPL
ncbi:MAG: glycoside hydrolase family 16 protein [Pseudonocardiales bacterium]|nr:glycoside hydrolase family 16 protein [Pseudonocardiales bacterium]